eukprot:jgi/Botrbrau1/19495/Bobra.0812s0002.1
MFISIFTMKAFHLQSDMNQSPHNHDSDGRKQAVPGDLARSSGDVFIVWRPNDFPYHYEDGIEHHVLWSSQALTHERIEQEIKERRKGYETVYWINPPVIMSIPGVWHCHILSRKPA